MKKNTFTQLLDASNTTIIKHNTPPTFVTIKIHQLYYNDEMFSFIVENGYCINNILIGKSNFKIDNDVLFISPKSLHEV
jgi:hypothetical protein